MRGRIDGQGAMFYTVEVESLIPGDHPLRGIKKRVDGELRRLRPHFEAAYSKMGRPSIPPEQLIKGLVLQALYSIRSERRLCEEIGYNILYRWFVDLPLDAAVWDHSSFTTNRKRFAEYGLMQRFFEGSVAHAIESEATSDEHFSVDGTLIEAWASMKSVRPKDEDPSSGTGDSNRWVDWHGEKRSNETHESKTDGEARLARKGAGREAILAHSMHVLMENRHGLVMGIEVAEANGTAERRSAERLLRRARRRHGLRPETLGADKNFDDGVFLTEMETVFGLTPHVPTRRGPIRDDTWVGEARRRARRRQRTRGYQSSQRCRKRIEAIFGWLKTIAGLRKTRFIGRWKTQLYAYAAAAAYNFLRLTNLQEA